MLATDSVGCLFEELFRALVRDFRLLDDNEMGLYTAFVGLNELVRVRTFSVYRMLFWARTGA